MGERECEREQTGDEELSRRIEEADTVRQEGEARKRQCDEADIRLAVATKREEKGLELVDRLMDKMEEYEDRGPRREKDPNKYDGK
jgi:hypothetical protein